MRAATSLLSHLSIQLAEELLHRFDPGAVVATIVTAMLVAACVLALRVKSRREAWLIVAVLSAGTLSVVLHVCALLAFRMIGLV